MCIFWQGDSYEIRQQGGQFVIFYLFTFVTKYRSLGQQGDLKLRKCRNLLSIKHVKKEKKLLLAELFHLIKFELKHH